MRKSKGRPKAWLTTILLGRATTTARLQQYIRTQFAPSQPYCMYALPQKASPLVQAVAAALSQVLRARRGDQAYAVTRQTLMRACARYKSTSKATKGRSMVSGVRRVTLMLECNWHLRL